MITGRRSGRGLQATPGPPAGRGRRRRSAASLFKLRDRSDSESDRQANRVALSRWQWVSGPGNGATRAGQYSRTPSQLPSHNLGPPAPRPVPPASVRHRDGDGTTVLAAGAAAGARDLCTWLNCAGLALANLIIMMGWRPWPRARRFPAPGRAAALATA